MKKKESDLFVFGAWFGQKFADNPKYLFLEFLANGKNAYWITKNEAVYKEMQDAGLPVLMSNSEQGRSVCARAKYIFICTSVRDVNEFCIGGAIIINLWHGVTYKKVMYDDDMNNSHLSLKNKVYDLITSIPYRKSYIVTTSLIESKILGGAFRLPDKNVLMFGQPRNDVFFNGGVSRTKYTDIFYDMAIVYMPTHRNEGKVTIDINRIFDLERLQEFCEKNNAVFIIKKHFYHKDEVTDLGKYSRILDLTLQQIDTQELLYNADILISDYSSVYIDYLLMNRPVVFYPYDYEDYEMNDREFYFSYNDITPGPKIHSYSDLQATLEEIVKNPHMYQKDICRVRDMFFDASNQGPVAHKFIEFVDNCSG